VIGELDGATILASETCALDIIGARFVKDVENGEIIVVSEAGIESIKPFVRQTMRPCIFEYIDFARPDSIVHGRSVYELRKRTGRRAGPRGASRCRCRGAGARSGRSGGARIRAGGRDCLTNSGSSATTMSGALSSSRRSLCGSSACAKHSANRAVVAGKRIVLLDDSIVRGTTSVKIVQMMRDAGAREVAFRISSPPITHPDYYGIDTPERSKLLAATHDLERDAALYRLRYPRLPVD
jgi:amidophosphoribosyltransferase